MNTELNPAAGLPIEPERIAPALHETRPFYWSVQRELWENHSIFIAPVVAAGVYMLGFLVSLVWVPVGMRQMGMTHSTPIIVQLAMPYAHAGMLLALTTFLTGIFYSLDALHGERRDRSILFWKSLPVSDLTTVLSKASIPLLVLPGIAFAMTVGLQIVMRILGTFAPDAAMRWSQLVEIQVVFFYSLIVLALWHAPLFGWCLLVSGWARRATFLWAVFPPLALAVLEFISFGTHSLALLLKDRLWGFEEAAFDLVDKNGVPIDPHFIPLAQLAPGKFLSSPGVWIGLIFAALCLVLAVRMRRYREPI
jgi:ABC-2 type transport system permease protein